MNHTNEEGAEFFGVGSAHYDFDELTGMPGVVRHEQEQRMGQDMKEKDTMKPRLNQNLIDAIYRMVDVDRFSGFPMIKKNTLVEHCYNVGNLFVEIAKVEQLFVSVEEIMFVFRHDLLETVTGDLLHPAKSWNEKISVLWEQIEEEIVNQTCFSWLSPYTDAWAKKNMSALAHQLFLDCDRLDLCLYLMHELKKGNIYTKNQRELGRVNVDFYAWIRKMQNSKFVTIRQIAEQIIVDISDTE